MADEQRKVRTPWYPLHSRVRRLIPILNGVRKTDFTALIRTVLDQSGTPQNPVDWSEPDDWIPKRLDGEAAALAQSVWEGTEKTVNPRHLYGSYRFIELHKLLEPDVEGIYRLTSRGQQFVQRKDQVVRQIDSIEGIPELLRILARRSPGKRGDILPEWAAFLRRHSSFGTASTTKDTLRRRLVDLVDRGLADREGISYTITDSGLAYLKKTAAQVGPETRILDAVSAFNRVQRETLRERLLSMPPERFEYLVRDLLEAMGYEEVQVVGQSGDKGVDVVATVQFGITTITEVVQVKRRKGNLGRQVVDQMRGALPYHKALRGTLITVGDFSRGSREAALFPGAAPITLINGDRLVELLLEHEIAVTKKHVDYYEVDEEYFAEPSVEEEAAVESEAAEEDASAIAQHDGL